MSMRRKPRPVFTVTVREHCLAGRWPIPATQLELYAADAEQARRIAVRMLHCSARVPPWKPCVRESLTHTTAELARAA